MARWQINSRNGVFRNGAAYPMLKRYQILSSYARTGSVSQAARENMVVYNTARSVCDKFILLGECTPGQRGCPPKIMEPYMVAYLEVMIFVDPFLYLNEMQQKLAEDLRLQPWEIPSPSVIYRTVKDLDLTRHKAMKVPQERFTPYNLARRHAFIQWRDRVDPRLLYFGDETAFNKLTDVRAIGRCHTGDALASVEPKRDVREKVSVFSVVGYNEGIVNAYPLEGSFNAVSLTNAIEQHFLNLLPLNSYLVLDNASIHNERALQDILIRRNITLVKMPTYSFDLNPIESVFGVVKAIARRTPGAIRQQGMPAIVNAFAHVDLEAVQSFYRRCWQVQF